MTKKYVFGIMLMSLTMLSAGCTSMAAPSVIEVPTVQEQVVVSMSAKEVPRSTSVAPAQVAENTGITEEDKIMYAVTTVNIRSSAAVDSEKLGTLTVNEEVHVTGTVGGWKRIDRNGVAAFVSEKYLSDVKVEVAVPAPSQPDALANSNTFDGDFPVDDRTREERDHDIDQAYIDAGWFDEDGNRIAGGNWSQ